MNNAQKKLNEYRSKYPHSFDASNLDADLQNFQLWSDSVMITAQLSRKEAITGIENGSYYVISSQAVGYCSSLVK